MAAKPNEIQIIRVYDAPVKLVWDAWTDPKQVSKWWGPRGFTITTKSKDLRPGGKWIYTMHGPDGTDYPNMTTYHEVEKYSRLVYDHGGNEESPKLFTVTVTFKEEMGKTIMNMIMAFDTAEIRKEMGKFIKQAGGNATWDRLAEFLEHESTGKDPFVINRSFEAPIKTMFEMWTNPEHISKWLAPTGFTMTYKNAKIGVHETATYYMTNGEMTHHGRIKYLAITPVYRLVYTQEFTDEAGNISRHPLAPTWPETMLTTVTFAEEGPNQTRVTVNWIPYGKTTEAELHMFHSAKPGMTMGWTGSFDKLEDLL